MYFFRNTFGNSFSRNTFGNSCDSNTFGNSFFRNTFGNSCYFNIFGNNIEYNNFGEGSTNEHFEYNHIENGCLGTSSTLKDWTTQTALYNKNYSVQIFGHRTSISVPTTNTYQYYDATGTLVKGTW